MRPHKAENEPDLNQNLHGFWPICRCQGTPLTLQIGDRQLIWQVLLVTTGEQGRSPPLCLLPRALPGTAWASRRDVWLSGSGAGRPPLKTPHPSIHHSAHIPAVFRGAGAARSWAPALFPPPRPDGWHVSQRNRQKKVSEEGKEIREQHRMLM